MAVTIPAITKPMTKSEKIMLRQLWPPSAYVRSCEQSQRSSSSAIDRSTQPLHLLPLHQMHKPACTIREEDGDERTFTRFKDCPCTVIGLLADLIFVLSRERETSLPAPTWLRRGGVARGISR